MTDQTSPIDFSVEDGIAVVVMARPKQRNAFSPKFQEDFRAIVDECRTRDDINAVVLSGMDGVFSAGGDIKGMVARAQEGGYPPEFMRNRLYNTHRMLQDFRNMEKPVIAAVDGPAYGGGFGLALCADFILASERAVFCSVFCRIGAIPDYGVLFTLPRMVGLQRAKELMATGRPVDANEAKAIGIAMDVYPAERLHDEAMSLARRMQDASAGAFGITKRIANQAFDNDADALLEMEAAGQAICLAGDYHKDAVNRFVEKRPLRFNWEAE